MRQSLEDIINVNLCAKNFFSGIYFFIVVHDAYGLFEALNANAAVKAVYYGLPDEFCSYYGKLEDIRLKLGLDAAGIRSRVERELYMTKRGL